MISARLGRFVLASLAVLVLAATIGLNYRRGTENLAAFDAGLVRAVRASGGQIITNDVPRKGVLSRLVVFQHNQCSSLVYAMPSTLNNDAFAQLAVISPKKRVGYEPRVAYLHHDLSLIFRPRLMVRYVVATLDHYIGGRRTYPLPQAIFMLVPKNCELDKAVNWPQIWEPE